VAEEEGTFTNLRGRVQRFLQAKAAGAARPELVRARRPAAGAGDRRGALPRRRRVRGARGGGARSPACRYETLGLQGAPVATPPASAIGMPLMLLRRRPTRSSRSRRWPFMASPRQDVVVFTVYMVSWRTLTLAERKVSAWIQDRRGPNRVGPMGLLQPAADGVKNFMKEETYAGGP
jgi:hypothetical protein